MSSAVWLARVCSPDDQKSEEVARVVVKFIQPSRLHYPLLFEYENDPTYSWDDYTTPDFFARHEAAGYDRLQELQGTVLPYFFGKDTGGAPGRVCRFARHQSACSFI